MNLKHIQITTPQGTAEHIQILLQQLFKVCSVGTTVHWMPLHLHPYYREKYGYVPGDFPVASALYPELVSLPLYPDMTEEDVNHVANSIKEILSRNNGIQPRMNTNGH